MHGPLPIIEITKVGARHGREKKHCCYIYLIKYNNQIHEGGWANENMAKKYADKLFSGEIRPKLIGVK